MKYSKGFDCMILTSFKPQSFPLSSGPDVHLEQDGSLEWERPIGLLCGNQTSLARLQVSDLVELRWAKWKEAPSPALTESDAVWMLGFLLLFSDEKMGLHPSVTLSCVLVCYHLAQIKVLFHPSAIRLPASLRSSRTLEGASWTCWRTVGPVVAQNLVWNSK